MIIGWWSRIGDVDEDEDEVQRRWKEERIGMDDESDGNEL